MLNILENESLSKYTTFHLGGPAKHFVIVENIEALKDALGWAAERGEKYFILGGGSNLLFSDAGFDGLVIKIFFREIEIKGEEVMAGAGAPLFLLVKKTVENSLAGLEKLSGIPGTVGGAAAVNAGAYGVSMSDILEQAEILYPDGRVELVQKEWFNYEYRGSRLKYFREGAKPVILRLYFKLTKNNKEALEEKIKEIIRLRAHREPKGFCAGCIFKNIKGERVEELLSRYNFPPALREQFSSRRAIPAAWFIEQAELGGKRIGGAYLSLIHANYIMNDQGARAEDVMMLISFIKQRVRDKFGLQLEEEVEIIV